MTSSSSSSDLLPTVDHFDHLPDSIVLLIFNKLLDVKTLGRCYVVSKRFQNLIPQAENVVVRVDCVISDDDVTPNSISGESRVGTFASFFNFVVTGIVKPIQALGSHILGNPSRLSSLRTENEAAVVGVTHHSPTQVLRNFNEIKFLKIELPSGELGIESDVLLKWRADFGSTLSSCVILGASSVEKHENSETNSEYVSEDGDGSIPDSFYTDGGLKLRVVWTISSLIAASARHYLLQPIIEEHKTLDKLVLSDLDGQGVLSMNKEQLEELRVKPLSASSASKRTLVPALNMRLWYAPCLVLPDGSVLKGATLVAIRPSSDVEGKEEVVDGNLVASVFDEPYGSAARMLVKRRTYSLEMNSF
ncbi:F-box protein-like protein [Tanacetum coccineum]